MHRLCVAPALLAIVALTVTGCVQKTSAPAFDAPDLNVDVSAVRQIDVDPIGEPATSGDDVVSYFRSQGGLAIAGWNMATGARLWQSVAVTDDGAPGVETTASIVAVSGESYVPFLAPAAGYNPGWDTLRIRDLTSGEDAQPTPNRVWAENQPGSCDDADGVCFTGRVDVDGRSSEWHNWEYVIASDTWRAVDAAADDASTPVADMMLSDHIFWKGATDANPEDMIGYLGKGHVRWKRGFESVFEVGYAVDGGWNWDEGNTDVVVGVGGKAPPTAGRAGTIDLTGSEAVGLSAKTGKTVWKLPHTGACTFHESIGVDASHLVLCRFDSGIAHYDSLGRFTRSDDVDAHLEVVDSADGRVIASWVLSHDDAFPSNIAGFSALRFAQSADRMVIRAGTDTRIIDLETGAAMSATHSIRFFCSAQRAYFDAPYQEDESHIRGFTVGSYLVPCDADEKAMEGTRASVWAVKHAGTRGAHGYYAIAGRHTIDVYHLAE